MVLERVITAPYVKGAYEFLSGNHKKYDFFISSGTPENEIKEFVKRKSINSYFKGIFGSPEKKDKHVKTILNMYGYINDEVIFVGDSPSDRNAAEINDIHFIARITNESAILDVRVKLTDLTNLEKAINILYV